MRNRNNEQARSHAQLHSLHADAGMKTLLGTRWLRAAFTAPVLGECSAFRTWTEDSRGGKAQF